MKKHTLIVKVFVALVLIGIITALVIGKWIMATAVLIYLFIYLFFSGLGRMHDDF